MKIIESEKKLGEVIPNIATMLQRNADCFKNKMVFQEREGSQFIGTTWDEFYSSIENIAYNLGKFGYKKGDKVVIYSKNCKEMLLLELAVMASGGISVPIFFNYNKETAEALIKHSDAKFLAVGSEIQLCRIRPEIEIEHIFAFNNLHDDRFTNLSSFNDLLTDKTDNSFTLNMDSNPDDICLNMYTSGTMGKQKCAQLTHKNILSQQAALKMLWNIDENDRFLSYLRWHHSFGGIFEKFTALCSGAAISLESSHGLDPDVIMENWKLVKPTVFFSVPMVYQLLVDMTMNNKELEKSFFHPDLKFVFTAAAPLPRHISDEFEKRNIPVIEGWGLTETSPCCTLTDPKVKRVPGVIGKPIPGIKIGLADDGEILVKGPNVMPGYYKNKEANERSFNKDGWYCTGDIGEITEYGLKLITRKDRIFKLSNAEKVIPTELESIITGKCHYIAYALVEGSGRNYPVALLFPDKMLIKESNNGHSIEIDNCTCPKNLEELSSCLRGCLINVNCGLKQKFARIRAAMLIDDELKVDNRTLTPSMKLVPTNVKNIYKSHIESLYGTEEPVQGNAYVIFLEE
jgi:long-subunit acyl-CoA synthetase (AMP-forming)